MGNDEMSAFLLRVSNLLFPMMIECHLIYQGDMRPAAKALSSSLVDLLLNRIDARLHVYFVPPVVRSGRWRYSCQPVLVSKRPYYLAEDGSGPTKKMAY
jgi:hypothetical protein